jgi:hypothetical protein
MAGRRQHYVPKFLQRQFLARNDLPEKGERVWWHFRGNPARPLEISHIGVAEYFYSRARSDGEPTLDDRISAQETPIQVDLAAVLEAAAGDPIEPLRAARLVTHFVLRTAFIRSAFAEAAAEVISMAIATVRAPTGARAYLGIDDHAPSPYVIDIVRGVREQLGDMGIAMPPRLADRLLAYLVRERFDELTGSLDAFIEEAHDQLLSQLPDQMAAAHKQVLSQDEPMTWEARLGDLAWHVHSVDGAILPDCIAIARTPERAWAPLLLVDLDELESCVFPIADERLLVGTRAPPFVPELAEINAASAACSDEFFIAALPMDHLGDELGMRTTQVIRAGLESALSDARQRTASRSGAPTERSPPTDHVPVFEYSLAFPLSIAPEEQGELTQLIRLMVHEMSRVYPLIDLDGITFAAHYASALAQIAHDNHQDEHQIPAPRTFGDPIASAVVVLRDGRRKQHLVYDWSVAKNLLSKDETQQRAALHILVSLLAHLPLDALYMQPMMRTTPRFPDSFTEDLCPAIASAPSYYYTYRAAANFDPSAGVASANSFQACMTSAREAMALAHERYAHDHEVAALLNVAREKARDVIDHAAQWCGHIDGLNPENATDDEATGRSIMEEVVGQLDLSHWLKLLHEDLHNLFVPGQPCTVERICALIRHAERLMWVFRVCPWPQDDGSTYVTVPAVAMPEIGR